MAKLNYKKIGIVAGIIFLINLIFYYGMFILCNEFSYRVSYEVRNRLYLLYMVEFIAISVPVIISILYFIFKDKLREKFNTSNQGFTLLIFCILYLITGIILDVVIGLLLKNNVLAYCNLDLETSSSFGFNGCFLRGIEYILMMILIFLPLFIVPVFELLIFIHKKITKKVKLDFIDILAILLVFIIICFVIWLIYYTFIL